MRVPIGLFLLFQCAFGPLELSAQAVSTPIKHVVIVFQENRTPDNLFHGLPNADIANSGLNSQGQRIALKPMPLATDYDTSHSHAAFLAMYNGGEMNGADKVEVKCGKKHRNCKIPGHPQFKYVDPADVAPYFQLAQQYTFADRMFQTNQGPSYAAHQFIISGTSAPSEDSDLFVAELPFGGHDPRQHTGCTAPLTQRVQLIDPVGDESQTLYPCFEHATLMDLLDAQGLSWRYYAPGPGSIWTAPNSIRHLRFGLDWENNVVMDPTAVLKDISGLQLATVSWVNPDGLYSDHSGGNDGTGPSWVASIVNAIGQSQYWNNTAILITWDDWGGWYDHVAPEIINSYEYGFRVPLIVVSPFAKPGYVSHVTHDFGSILKFVEHVYNLPSLGYADERADNLSDCFDFRQTPLKFKTIVAPLDAEYFLRDRRTFEDPDDD